MRQRPNSRKVDLLATPAEALLHHLLERLLPCVWVLTSTAIVATSIHAEIAEGTDRSIRHDTSQTPTLQPLSRGSDTAIQPSNDSAPLGGDTAQSSAGQGGLARVLPKPPILKPPSLWPAVRHNFELDHRLDLKRVQQEIAWLKNNPAYFERLEPRFQRYSAFVYAELQRRNMPAELVFIPVIESALDPFAFSPGGAAGLWQFMPATAKRFGLAIDWWVDERRDPVFATLAALDYLQALYRRFDDWYLAIAAYNSGEGRLNRAIKRADNRDFFALKVPKETAGYVPRLLAFAAVFADPEAYGIELPEVTDEVQFTTLELEGQFEVARVADVLGLATETLFDWNPALNQWATPPAGPHRLLVDQEFASTAHAQTAQEQLALIPAEERLNWVRYTVKAGDTVNGIARRFNTDVKALQAANDVDSHIIKIGATLLVPTAANASETTPLARRAGTGKRRYKVRAGDSLWSIGERFAVSPTTLMRLNHIGPNQALTVGKELIIPAAKNSSVIKKINYRVRTGDSLSTIANRFNIAIHEILNWNPIDPGDYLQPGQKLRLYVDVTATQ